MTQTNTKTQAPARCTLCPAGCELSLGSAGPDMWFSEPPLTAGVGLCARGSTLGELISSPRRILELTRRTRDKVQHLTMSHAVEEIIRQAAGRDIVIMLDGGVSCRQMVAAAAWCDAWEGAKLCMVLQGGDEQLLAGMESVPADYLAHDDLSGCDGFVIVGDVFAADPRCANGVFDRHAQNRRTPIVAIDSACGTAAKFATHAIDVPPGGEFYGLSALSAAAGVQAPGDTENHAALSAAKALTSCKRLGVLVAAEYARGVDWRSVGYLASKLAARFNGGVLPATDSANAPAAVRLASAGKTIPLVEALASQGSALVAIGCDPLGMLGWWNPQEHGISILAAAAALPNDTTASAEFILPLSAPGETSGDFMFYAQKPVEVAPLIEAPAGVGDGGQLVAELARAAGVSQPEIPDTGKAIPPRAKYDAPKLPQDVTAAPTMDSDGPVLLFARQAMHAGSGELTAHGTWQQAVQEVPTMRISEQDASELNLTNLVSVTLKCSHRQLRAKVSISPELRPGRVVLPAGISAARTLNPCRLEQDQGRVIAEPQVVQIDTESGPYDGP